MLKAKGRKRLEDMVRVLETKVTNPKWFNLACWASSMDFLKKECGTTGCAIGWYISAFPRRSLKLEQYLHNVGISGDIEDHFGINCLDSSWLFQPGNYPNDRSGVKSVIRRLKYFLTKNGIVNHSLYGGLR